MKLLKINMFVLLFAGVSMCAGDRSTSNDRWIGGEVNVSGKSLKHLLSGTVLTGSGLGLLKYGRYQLIVDRRYPGSFYSPIRSAGQKFGFGAGALLTAIGLTTLKKWYNSNIQAYSRYYTTKKR
jgi:hypothetical protein